MGTKLDATANKKPHAFSALAGEEGDGAGSDYESDHSARITHAGDLKKAAVQQAMYLYKLPGNTRAAEAAYRLQRCASWMQFRHYYTAEKFKLTKIETCGQHLLCPFCAAGRAARSAKAYRARFEVLRALHPQLKPIMLTLTVKNGDDLAERFRHLEKSFKTYLHRRRDSLKKGRGFCELSKLEGLVYSYEVTRGKDGSWHPHVHMVALAHQWIDQDKLSQEWQGITKDSTIVDVRRIRKDKAGGYGKAFAEVFKYALKFAGMSHGDTWHAYETLHGKRLTGSVGCFRGVVVPEDPTDQIDDVDGLPYLELMYRYRHGSGYNLTSTRSVQADTPPDNDSDSARAGECAGAGGGGGGDCRSGGREGGNDDKDDARHKAQALHALLLLLGYFRSLEETLSSEPDRTGAEGPRAVGCSLISEPPPEAPAYGMG